MSRILLLLRPGEARDRLATALDAVGKTPVEASPDWRDEALLVDRVHAAEPDVVVVGAEDGLDLACDRCQRLREGALTRYTPLAVLLESGVGPGDVERVLGTGVREVLSLEDPLALVLSRIDHMAALSFLRRTFRRQHDALAARTAELDRVFETVTTGLALSDASAHVQRVNPAGRAILGEDASSLTGASLHTPDGHRVSPEEHPLYRAAVGGESARGERLVLRRTDPPEDRVLVVDAEPLHGAYGELTGGLAVFRDETDSVRLQEELAKRNEEMQAFVYTASHDMKSPLQTIRRYAKLVRDDAPGLDEESVRSLERIEVNAQRLAGLVDGLVRVVKVGRIDLVWETCNLEQVVRDALRPLEGQIRQVDAQIEVDPSLPVVIADHERLVDVFENLIGNALKYRRPNTPCRVSVGHVPTSDDEDVHVFVRDEGIGIAPENHGRIFGLFQRLHRRDEIEGSGLGLAIVSRILERLGGRVWVESSAGAGATFHVGLPRRGAAPA